MGLTMGTVWNTIMHTLAYLCTAYVLYLLIITFVCCIICGYIFLSSNTYALLDTVSARTGGLPLPKLWTKHFWFSKRPPPPTGFAGARDLVTLSPQTIKCMQNQVFIKYERIDKSVVDFLNKNYFYIWNPNNAKHPLDCENEYE